MAATGSSDVVDDSVGLSPEFQRTGGVSRFAEPIEAEYQQ